MSLFPLSTAAGQFRVFLTNSWSVPFQKFLPFLAPQRRRQRAPNESGQVPPLARKKRARKIVCLPPSSFLVRIALLLLPASLPSSLSLSPRPGRFRLHRSLGRSKCRIHQVSPSNVFPWTIKYFVRCFEYFFESLGESSARLLRPSSLLPLRSLRPSPQFEREGGRRLRCFRTSSPSPPFLPPSSQLLPPEPKANPPPPIPRPKGGRVSLRFTGGGTN